MALARYGYRAASQRASCEHLASVGSAVGPSVLLARVEFLTRARGPVTLYPSVKTNWREGGALPGRGRSGKGQEKVKIKSHQGSTSCFAGQGSLPAHGGDAEQRASTRGKQHTGPPNSRKHQSMSTAKTNAAPHTPWHGDFAGAATDSVLLLCGLLVAFCVLSGKWWVAAYTGFFVLLATLVTLMGAHLDYNAQVVLEERAKAARRAPKPRGGEGYN